MHLKANLIGSVSVILWGMSTAISLLVSKQIGALAYFTLLFTCCGLLGIALELRQKAPRFDKGIFYNKYFYLRGIFFIIHESLSITAIYIVSKEFVPVVILINYLWPSAIIFCSILIAGVRIYHWPKFILGSTLVIASLAFEIVGSKLAALNIFSNPKDLLAYGMTFIGAISWGLYCAFTRKGHAQSGGGAAVKYYQLAFVLFAPLLLIFPPLTTAEPQFTLIIFGICLLFNFVSYICWDYGMRNGNIVILSLTADLIPWISLTFTSFIHDIEIHPHTILSAILLVFGAIISRSATLQSKKSNEELSKV